MSLYSKKVVSDSYPHVERIAFFRLAFRPLFWLGALFSSLAIAIWVSAFNGYISFIPLGNILFWHIHEMLFGFTAAIIVGFLLTAVRTWTGIHSLNGWPLVVLASVWLFARVLLAFPSSFPTTMIIVFDLLFLPLAALALARPIIKAKLWRNLFFVPLLLLMAILNLMMHLSIQSINGFAVSFSFVETSHIMVLLVALIMCIMGGRVFPMFTANSTKTPKVLPIAWIEKLSIFSVSICVLLSIPAFTADSKIHAAALIIAGLINFIRAFRWRIWITWRTPLVWSLHISYWSVCVGLVMLGMYKLEILSNGSLAYHAITVGGIGQMILSMISRVSLGHTGRSINVGSLMTFAMFLIGLSFLIRVFTPLFFDSYLDLILISGICWVIGYALFIVLFTPILFKSRIDGKDG